MANKKKIEEAQKEEMIGLHAKTWTQSQKDALALANKVDLPMVAYIVNNYVVARSVISKYDYGTADKLEGNALVDIFNDRLNLSNKKTD